MSEKREPIGYPTPSKELERAVAQMQKQMEERLTTLVDRKLKNIKTRLQKLAEAHDAIAKQQEQATLETQRMVASLKINSDTNSIHSIIANELSDERHLVAQLFSDASTAKSAIFSSNTPFEIASEFYNKWQERLKKSGAKVITF